MFLYFCVWRYAGSWWALTIGSLPVIALMFFDPTNILFFLSYAGYSEDARAKFTSDMVILGLVWLFLRVWLATVDRYPNSFVRYGLRMGLPTGRDRYLG